MRLGGREAWERELRSVDGEQQINGRTRGKRCTRSGRSYGDLRVDISDLEELIRAAVDLGRSKPVGVERHKRCAIGSELVRIRLRHGVRSNARRILSGRRAATERNRISTTCNAVLIGSKVKTVICRSAGKGRSKSANRRRAATR